MSKKVGVILVNYKDYATRFLTACRDSLRAQSYAPELMKIYIVDNAATVESQEYLKKTYPEAIILSRTDGNYAAANNLGFSRASKDDCEYLVTLNMDTEVEPAWLAELVKALEINFQAGIAQSKIFLYPKNDEQKRQPLINSLGNIIHFLGFGFTDGYGQADRNLGAYPEIKGYASGCSFIIRSILWQKIGGYEEEFYMYHDDLELSLKVRLAGYKIILAPLSKLYHKYEFKRSTKMLYYMERNRYLTMLMFYPTRLLLFLFLPALIMELGLLLYSIIGLWLPTRLQVCLYFCRPKNYVRILLARKKIKAMSVIKFSTLAKDFSGRIEFQEINNPVLRYFVNPVFNIYWSLVKKNI